MLSTEQRWTSADKRLKPASSNLPEPVSGAVRRAVRRCSALFGAFRRLRFAENHLKLPEAASRLANVCSGDVRISTA
eukprot:12451078-Alexandrium_andersonii.AAC.1